jgi:P27 family predicted phage terminase small subunit
MRGRKPKPTQQQINEGDPRKRGVNKLNEELAAQPRAEKGLPECPDYLGKRARAAWVMWKEELEKMRLDCRPDGPMLEGACVNYERAVEADLMIAKSGLVVAETLESGARRVKANPAIAISNAAWRQVRSFCSEFGLSPVSRTRLTIEDPGNATDDLLKLLSQPRERKVSTVQ